MAHESCDYRLVLRSHPGRAWLSSLPAVDAVARIEPNGAPIFTVTLRVTDQAELIGLLVELHGRGQRILSLAELSDSETAQIETADQLTRPPQSS